MKKYLFLFSSLVIMSLTSCSSNDPEIVNEEELITTLRVTLTPQGGGNVVTLQRQDLDGDDGPNDPVTTVSGPLQANTTYTGVTQVLNETESPAENITLEVEEEGDEHQFFYTFSNSIATVTYTDQDKNGKPIGITFNLATTTAGIGNLTVTLKHEPNKAASGVSAGIITNAGGETDVEATFNLTVN